MYVSKIETGSEVPFKRDSIMYEKDALKSFKNTINIGFKTRKK